MRVVLVVSVVALAAVLGWIGGSLAPESEPAPRATGPTITRAGSETGLLVHAAPGWRTARTAPDIPGIDTADAAVFAPWEGATSRVVVAFLPLADESLLPPELLDALKGPLPEAESAHFASRSSLVYRELPFGSRDTVVDVFAAPTLEGVITAACVRKTNVVEAATGCRSGVADVVAPGSPIPAGEDAAFLQRLRTVTDRLSEQRTALRADLGTGTAPGRRLVRPARALAEAYGDALEELAPFAADTGPSAETLAHLRWLRSAYGRLAVAAELVEPRRFAAARSAIDGGERRLAAELTSIYTLLRGEAALTNRRREAALEEAALQ